MTHRRAHVWGAAIIAAGALLGVTAALWAGRPGSLWRPLVIGLVSYAASGALVLRWGLEVYGAAGALGAVALVAFTPGVLAALAAPPLVAPAGGTTLAGGFAQLAATYALMRCLLDPTLQWAVLAGLVMVAVPIGAFLHGSSTAAMVALAVLSLLLVAVRLLTAERCESRARVAQASAASVALAWALALALLACLLVVSAEHAPEAEGYATAFDAPPPSSVWWAVLPLAALLLAAARPWRRQRRFTDAGWSAALLCLGVPLWLAWGEPGGVFMAPFAALLAGACWDGARPAWARRAATLVVLAQMVAGLLLWPHYPGGVRSDAWLPMPGISSEDFEGSAIAWSIAGGALLTSRDGPSAHPDRAGSQEAP